MRIIFNILSHRFCDNAQVYAKSLRTAASVTRVSISPSKAPTLARSVYNPHVMELPRLDSKSESDCNQPTLETDRLLYDREHE